MYFVIVQRYIKQIRLIRFKKICLRDATSGEAICMNNVTNLKNVVIVQKKGLLYLCY